MTETLQPNIPFGQLPLSVVLQALASDSNRERIYLSDLVLSLGDRALGALLFIFAIPNVFPTPPGTSTVLGAPLIFLAAQVMFARRPWLPAIIAKRSMSRQDFQVLIRRISPWLERAENLLKPRYSVLAMPPMEYFVGLICLFLAVVLVLPVPLGNVLPALAISIMALGLLERDGLWVSAGIVIAVVSMVVVSGVVFAVLKTAAFFFTQALQ